MTARFRIGVLSSPGGGLTTRLLDAAGVPNAGLQVVRVMTASPEAPVLARALAAGVPAQVAPLGDALWRPFDEDAADGILLLGWLRLLEVPHRWRGRVVNAHPGPLPAFGGKGMWGRRVHEAVLAAGAAASRATYHIVDEEYDHGPVIYEVPVPVLPDDDAVALETRVIEAQHQSLIPFVTAWARGQIKAPALAGRASEGTTD